MQARLYADLDKRKTLFLVEEWESREQFENNLDTPKLNTIVAAIELSSEPPVVRSTRSNARKASTRWRYIEAPQEPFAIEF